MNRRRDTTRITNPKASPIPKPLGTFASAPKPEPITPKPRRRLGASLDGGSVDITNKKAAKTSTKFGGSA